MRDSLEPGYCSITRRRRTQKWATCCTRRATCCPHRAHGPMTRDIASLNAGAVMADASLNRRQTIRVGAGVAFAQVGIVGFDGQIELEALRLFGLPEAAPAVLNGTPLLTGALFGSGRREFAAEVSWDLPNLAAGVTTLLDVTVNGARAGDLAAAMLSVGVTKRRVP